MRPASWSARRLLDTVLLLALVGAPCDLDAQPTAGGKRFSQLSLDEGLVQSTVHSVLQGQSGLVYLGTQRGALRFDGYHFVPIDPGGSLDTPISALLEVDGRLLIGTLSRGLGWVDLSSGLVTHLDEASADGRPSLEICALESTGDPVAWIGSSRGVDRFDLETGRWSTVDLDIDGPACALAASKYGLWVGVGGRLRRIDPETAAVVPDAALADLDVSPLGGIHALLASPSGALYVGGDRGLLRLDIDSSAPARLAIPTPTAVLTLAEDARGLWIGTHRGLFRLEPGRDELRPIEGRTDSGTLAGEDSVLDLTIDASGLVWIGTRSQGVLQFDPGQERFRGLTVETDERPGLSHPVVWSVLGDADGSLTVATGGGGIDHFDGATGLKTNFRHDPNRDETLSTDRITALSRLRDGGLLVGGTGGQVDRLDLATGRVERWGSLAPLRETAAKTEAYTPIRALVEDHAGRIWAAGWRAGLAVSVDPSTPGFAPFPDAHTTLLRLPAARHASVAPELSTAARRIGSMVEDEHGILWLTTYGDGLHAIAADRRTYTIYRHLPGDADSLMTDHLQALALGVGDRLWIGSLKGELASFDRRTRQCTPIERWNRRAARERWSIYSAIEDQNRQLWLGTNAGLVRFDPALGTIRRFGQRDGLVNPELNSGAVFHEPTSGELLFGGVRGVDRFHPDHLGSSDRSPATVVTSIRSGNTRLRPELAAPTTHTVELGPDDRDVLFEIATLDYRQPRAHRYAYRLVGHDDAWIDAGTRRTAAFSNLPGGDYVFQARGTDAAGSWSDDEVTVHVRVVPPLWQTLGFRLGTGALLLVLAVSVPLVWARHRLATIAARRREEDEARRRLLAAREEERARLAREIHDGPLQDLSGLRLQLRSAVDRTDGPFEQVDRMAADLRDLCRQLRPPTLVEGDLASAIESQLTVFAEHHPGIDLDADLMTDGETPPRAERVQLFRIVQEALANVGKHANASAVSVRLEIDAEGDRLEIEDDGSGFTVPKRWIELGRQECYGLLGMAERASLIGAHLDVESSPGAGTRVRVVVPPVTSHTPNSEVPNG